MSRFERAWFNCWAATLALVLGCGGNVNLGGKGSAGAGANANGGAPTTTDPDPSASTSVVKLQKVALGNLTAAGAYLYFTGYGGEQAMGLYRCDKARCKATLKLLAKGSFGFPQLVGDRLGISRFNEGSFDLMMFTLPDASSPQVVLSDLPAAPATPALFLDNFVYFALMMDGSIYRCAQPDCAAGPERIAPVRERNYVKLYAEADLLFWSDPSFINRAGDYGHAPVETLLPDEQLSAAPAEAVEGSNPDASPADGVESIAVEDGMLYASISRSRLEAPCDGYCPHEIVGWPVGGGPSQVFFRSETLLRSVAVVDGELMWLGPSAKTLAADAATISTCRVEACEATHRELGQVRAESAVFAADEHDVYWFEAEAELIGDVVTGFAVEEIRRAARLPKP
jgi:hypothetical protein